MVHVYVGQDLAPFVRIGDPGEVTLDQEPGARVQARVDRMADAIDPRSRSMLVELSVDPEPGAWLVPGLFVHVDLHVATPAFPTIPSDALISRGERLQVATVRDDRLHFVDVVPGETDGRRLQIREGLTAGEVVALPPLTTDGRSRSSARRRKPGSAPAIFTGRHLLIGTSFPAVGRRHPARIG